MKPCSLSSGCITEAQLRGKKLLLVEPQFSLDFSNLDSPAKLVPIPISPIILDPGIYMHLDYSMNSNDIVDSYGFLRANRKRKSFIDVREKARITNGRNFRVFQCAADVVQSSSCQPYVSVEIHASGTSVLIERTYRSITDTFGDIGGIKEVLFLAISFFYRIYNQLSLKKFLADTVFDLRKNSEDFAETILFDSGSRNQVFRKKLVKKEIQRVAGEAIEQATDLVNIIRDMNRLHALVEFVFGPGFEDFHAFIGLGKAQDRKAGL